MVGLTLVGGEFLMSRSLIVTKGTDFMKQIEEKLKRKVKYWRISYRQASGRDRLYLGLYSLLILIYLWWYILVQ
jgi:hypothetical protein